MAQNIYDDPAFFAGYSQLPRQIHGLAGASEWPSIRACPRSGRQACRRPRLRLRLVRALGARLRASGSDGLVYPSVRRQGGDCVVLFWPDLARDPVQGRHLDYHWNGERVDLYREAGTGRVFRIG